MKKQIGIFTAILFAVSTLLMACKAEVHTHTFSSKWTGDETNHWHPATCEHKDKVIDKAKHTFGDWTITKEATEEAEGSKERTCTVCGYTATEAIEKLEHTHKFATDWTSDETNHWHASTCGHEVTEGKTAHTFGDWITTKAATEEETGSKERVCDVCKYIDTEVIAKLEHTHKFAKDWTKDETNHWHASTCGHEVTEGKTAHTFGDWITTKEATCTEEGNKTRTCEVCKKEVTEKIDAKGHNYSESRTKDVSGHWYACVCGEKKDFEEHTYDIGKIVQEATCTQEGKKTVYCTVCKYEKEETIPAKGHSYSGSWKKDDKNHWKECIWCKEKIDVKGHSYSESRTKDASGHWYECECGAKKDFEEHTYDIWKVVQKPTASTEGTSKRECKICSFEEIKQIIPIPEGFVFVQGGTIEGATNTNNFPGVFIAGRTVTLSDFYMGKYEVTQEEYASVMAGQTVTVNGTEYALESNPSYCTKDSEEYKLFNGDVQEKRPVEGVTWYDAVWYCNALSEKEGLTKAYNIEVTEVKQESGRTGYYIYSANVTLNKNATGYRLPTEAEWEYAARGGDPTAADWNYVFSGADTAEGVSYRSEKNSGLDSVGWYRYNSINGTTGDATPSSGKQGYGTHQVGKKAPNRLDLYDMSGNVWEWCYDRYGTVNTGTETDPTGADSGSDRVDRGGSLIYGAYVASVSLRDGSGFPGRCDPFRGFRVVRLSN